MSYEDLKDKVVIVTGSSAGIGEAIAIQFSKNGSKLVITGRNEENLNKVASVCEQVSPTQYKPLIHICDLNKENEAPELVKKAVEHYGSIDVLVNNAGCVWPSDISDDDFMEKFDYVFNVNTRAPLLLTKLCLPKLIEKKGCIVNICSITSTRHVRR
ncbi:3-oxoacyl-[acyl-carrier-protein] reductase FabG-like isoform X2 [Leptotrombidium deliense]|uniref:3-oxoacyl-[acyl-carrier-protein] reductase FabG-like isoform X2 n=1 Tax=Leptotrombidium deliense TaxID=299467 RepID=A0A443SBH3_9ACAR|nr:3-oxoacyl-[acyl-carrier-protein] reductase FabG-like isoform X2 [Leptotrombidium deliense]